MGELFFFRIGVYLKEFAADTFFETGTGYGFGVQFARSGVRVNALCPGPVDTPLLRELFAKDPERAARRLVHLPMGRFARAEEIAGGALSQLTAFDSDETRAEPLQAGIILVAARLVDRALAAELGLDRDDREAV